jgi:hypothetical protein
MPVDRHGPDDRGDATLPGRLISGLLALAALAPAACREETPPPGPAAAWHFSVRAETVEEPAAYGAVVPMTFAVTNRSTAPIFLRRLEATVGERWEMWAAPTGQVRIEPDESYDITVMYRVLEHEDEMFLTAEPVDPRLGDKLVRRSLKVPVSCPERPFDDDRFERKFESWTFSRALGGFVFRATEYVFSLVLPEGGATLPPMPFRFLKDIDMRPEGVGVLLPNDEVRAVTAANLAAFLSEVRTMDGRLRLSGQPDRAPYEVLQ